MEATSMPIVIAGTVVMSAIFSSVLLLSAVTTGKRGDRWPKDTPEQPPAKPSGRNTPRPRAGGSR